MNLIGANLYKADLRDADLRDACLINTNLSQTKGLLSASDWLSENFETNEKGYVVYKAEGNTYFKPPAKWKRSKFITEVPNPSRTSDCGCGVSFATLDWIKPHFGHNAGSGWTRVRRMYLHYKDLPDVVVPYNTNGKARCGRLEKGRLIEI